MTEKTKPAASLFDAYLQADEAILWADYQEWFNDRRITRGHKTAWAIILILAVVLVIVLTLRTVLGAVLIIGMMGGLRTAFQFSRLSRPTPSFVNTGAGPATRQGRKPLRMWYSYAVTNKQLLAAVNDHISTMKLQDATDVGIVFAGGKRGDLTFTRPRTTLTFYDIPNVGEVHRLILEQQKFLQREKQESL